jgi:hypothetical protein
MCKQAFRCTYTRSKLNRQRIWPSLAHIASKVDCFFFFNYYYSEEETVNLFTKQQIQFVKKQSIQFGILGNANTAKNKSTTSFCFSQQLTCYHHYLNVNKFWIKKSKNSSSTRNNRSEQRRADKNSIFHVLLTHSFLLWFILLVHDDAQIPFSTPLQRAVLQEKSDQNKKN